MRALRVLLLVATVLPFVACASSGGSEGPSRRRNQITREEIAQIQVTSAYEAIQQLRPEFFRSRGVRSMASGDASVAAVYVDGVRQGGLEALRNIPKETVEDIRYLSATDATTQFGTGHAGGAILVRTRR